MKQGFTLIELLVVVLIIGILAAVALPQYQKAVERSKAMQALTTLKSIQTIATAYYMANGEYPFKFNELAMDLTNMNGHIAQLPVSSPHVKDTISDQNWSLQIQQDPVNGGQAPYHLVMMTRISGNYKGAGFQVSFYRSNEILCIERKRDANFIFQKPLGSFCKGIMKGKPFYESAYQDVYYL